MEEKKLKTCDLTNYQDDYKEHVITGGGIFSYYRDLYYKEVSEESLVKMKEMCINYVKKGLK